MFACLTRTRGLVYKSLVQQHPRGRRRLRLFNVAVARRVAHLVDDASLPALLEAAEGLADGTMSKEVLADLSNRWRVSHYPGVDDDAPDYYYRHFLDRYGRE